MFIPATQPAVSSTSTANLLESTYRGMLILSSRTKSTGRRVLFVNSYGGPAAWYKIKKGLLPPHHLWGCIELAQMGYQVGIAEPLSHFSVRKHPLPHDLRLWGVANEWLRPDDILFSGHTLLHWLPLLKRLKALRCHFVSLTYARENLEFAEAHSGIIALTPAAANQARIMAPKVKVVHLGWGVDLSFFPKFTYQPEFLLMCGRTHRDYETLSKAAFETRALIRIISPNLPPGLTWPETVTLTTGGSADDTVSYNELLHDYYARASAALIVLKEDPTETSAVGFTNLIEAMAMRRPVIVTKTGALVGELDVSSVGCGIHIPPGNPTALADAIKQLSTNPDQARQMGEKGRELCESHYNINRFVYRLHAFFQDL